MKLSQMGIFATNALENLPSHYKYAQVPLFVVMPNHIHAIVCIETPSKHPECMPSQRAALSVVIGGFKQSVTLFANQHNIKFEWQSRYHNHIIRGIHDGNNISEYIQNNVARWDNDCYNRKHTSKAIIRKSHNSRDAPQVRPTRNDKDIQTYFLDNSDAPAVRPYSNITTLNTIKQLS